MALSAMAYHEVSMKPAATDPQGFSRGSSSYRGVTAHPSGRWESRIGIPGSRHVYLGLYLTEPEAARAYDAALVRLRGLNAATNYSLAEYRLQLAESYEMQGVSFTGEGGIRVGVGWGGVCLCGGNGLTVSWAI